MDSIDEIDSQKRRSLENAQRVSTYLRVSAKKEAQRSAAEIKPEEPKDEESDKLDFSSEFTSQDMGMASESGFTKVLDWHRAVEEEERQRERDPDDEEKEQAEEWQSGSWTDKDDDQESASPEPEEQLFESDEDEPLEESEESLTEGPPANAGETHDPTADGAVAPRRNPFATAAAADQNSAEAPPPGALAPNTRTASKEPGPSLSQESLAGAVPPPPPVLPPAPGATVQRTAIIIPERLRPVAHMELPTSGQMAQIDPDLATAASRLITNSPQDPGYEECVRLLARFGLGALRMCGRSRVGVEILDSAAFPSHPALGALGLPPDHTPCDGAYVVGSRLVLVERSCLTSKPRFFHPALYYFAHAFDHAQGGETFSSRKAAAVVACFEASTRADNGFDFVDELAAADPVRYFARSAAVYLGRDDCADPLWTHQDLYDFDRSMYDYLDYLFARLKV